MKKLLLSVGVLLSLNAVAQNVGINATGAAPVTSAALDVDMANKGILIPRVALTTTTAFAPVTGTATTSLLVYNSATAGTFPTNVTPGYYYWNGSAWVRLVNSGTAWELLGNQGTTQGTNFLGTIDNVGLDLRTNNTLRQRIFNTGETAFNSATAFTGDIVASYATGTQYAINGYLTGSGAGQTAYFSNASSSNASGTLMSVSSGVGYNAYFQISSTANTLPSTVSISQTTTGTAMSASVNSGGTYTTVPTTGSGGAFTHPTMGLYAAAVTSATGNGICTYVGAATVSTFTGGSGGTFVHPNQGVYGVATASTNGTFGGYFANGTSFAYVGYRTGGTNYKINGNGTVSTIVDDVEEGKKVNMFCPEAPEVLFQDYGTAQLVNGTVHITIDPIFAKNIFVDASHPLKVFVQLEGDCKGVYVTNKTANGFDVIELQGGTSNTQFSWTIVANRIDTKLPDGTIDSKFQDVRFPEAPSMQVPTTTNTKENKQPTERKTLLQEIK